jgi:NADH-quinone oxidoreductase subunit N
MILARRQYVLPEAVSLVSLVIAALTLYSAPTGIYSGVVVDSITKFFGYTFLIVSLITVIGTWGLEFQGEKPVYYSLILASTTGMLLVGAANDILVLIAAWELMTIPTYLLAGFIKNDIRSKEAGIKYFLAGAISSSITVYGFSLAYGLTGATRLNELVRGLSELVSGADALALVSGVLILSGFAVKMAMAPFHLWLPDTLTGAPPTASALIAAGTKKAGFAAAIRVLVLAYLAARAGVLTEAWPVLLGVMAVLTMTWGNLAALTQRNLPRMLALSSIGQSGYIVIGLAVQGTSGALLGSIGLLLHVLFHGVMKSAAFVGVRIFGSSYDELAGVGRKAPLPSALLTLILFSLAGMPPFAGFWSKLYLFLGAVEAGLAWLALAGLINSALSLGYYGYLVKVMFMDEPTDKTRVVQPLGPLVALLLAGVFVLIVGIYPTHIVSLAEEASKTLIP